MDDGLAHESVSLRMARAVAACFPKGHRTILNAAAKISGSPQRFVAPIRKHGFKLQVELDEAVCRTVYVRGCFEPAITRVFSELMSAGDVVLDVGANFGYFTLLAAQRVGKAGACLRLSPIRSTLCGWNRTWRSTISRRRRWCGRRRSTATAWRR